MASGRFHAVGAYLPQEQGIVQVLRWAPDAVSETDSYMIGSVSGTVSPSHQNRNMLSILAGHFFFRRPKREAKLKGPSLNKRPWKNK